MAERHEVQLGDSVLYLGKRCVVSQISKDGRLTLHEEPSGQIFECVNEQDVLLVMYPNPENN